MPALHKLDRRNLLAGSAVAGSVAVISSRFVFAQDSTPEVTDDDTVAGATPDADATPTATTAARIEQRLALVREDVESVRSDIDASTIDAVLTSVDALIGQIPSTPDTGAGFGAIAFSASAGLRAVHSLLRGQIMYPGLPSEQARSSRILSQVYALVSAPATTVTETAAAIDPDDIRVLAQSAYATAYEHYQNGAWAQANLTGIGAAETLAMAANFVADGMLGFDRIGPGGSMPPGRNGGGTEATSDLPPGKEGEEHAPVDVPEPVFE